MLTLLISFWGAFLPLATAQRATDGAAPVAIAPVIRREIAAGQTFVASVTPLKRAIVGSAVDGRLVKMLVEEGQRVSAGQPLAQLLTTTIELELKVAEAELMLRQAELTELKNGPLPDEIEQAKAKMLGAKANLDFAKNGFERIEALYRNKAVTHTEYDEALARYTASEHTYIENRLAHALLVAGNREERITQAQARFLSQEATVELIRDRLKKFTVITNFDGYVVSKMTESGAWLRSGDPVVEVVALDEVEIKAFVTEEHVPFIRNGMEVRIEVPAIANQIFTGKVVGIVPQADVRARTFPVNIRIQNEITDDGPMIKSGMYARAELPTGATGYSLMVPKDAIVVGGSHPVVFVVQPPGGAVSVPGASPPQAGTVKSVVVELGVASGPWIAVKGELNEGEWVVAEGNERLRSDQSVSVISSLSAGGSGIE